MHHIQSNDALQAALQKHANDHMIIFKHSTTCPISAAAYRQVEAFESSNDIPIYLVRVIEERPLSLGLAESLGVKHASPQVIYLNHGNVEWTTSHYDITENSLSEHAK
jgi:bacillithiol system protein YtxJ